MPKVHVVGHVKAKQGHEAELEQLIGEFVETVSSKDPATEAFGFFRDGRPGHYVAVEVYRDSHAAMAHLDNVTPLLGQLAELLDPDGGEPLQVYGEVSPELQERYAAFNAVYFPTVSCL